MSKPFAGVRILDFTRYLAGPYGTYQLALLGGAHTAAPTLTQSRASRPWSSRASASVSESRSGDQCSTPFSS